MAIHVLVADDSEIVRRGLSEFFPPQTTSLANF
jgi:hypothetical protein